MEVRSDLDDLKEDLGPDEAYLFISPNNFKVLGERVKVRGETLVEDLSFIEFDMILTSLLDNAYVAYLGKLNHGLGIKGVYTVRNKKLVNIGWELYQKHGGKIANQVGVKIYTMLNSILEKYGKETGFTNESFFKSKIHYLHGDGLKPFVKDLDNLLNSYKVLPNETS